MTSVNQSQVSSPLQVPKIPNSHIQEQQGKRGSGFTCAGGQHNQANQAPCGFTSRLPRQPWSGRVATRSQEEPAAFEVRAALRLQTRNAQACSQSAQAPPRSDFSKKCLSSRSPEHPGRVHGSLAEPRPPQVVLGDPVFLLPPLRASPGICPSTRPIPRTGPDRTGPSWAARTRPLTMASLFKKKTVDGEFWARLTRLGSLGSSGLGSRAVPRGGPGSAAPQVTMAESLRLYSLTWPVRPPDCSHPTLVFFFSSPPPFPERVSQLSGEAEQCWLLVVVRLGELMDFMLVFSCSLVPSSVKTSHFLTSERDVCLLGDKAGGRRRST